MQRNDIGDLTPLRLLLLIFIVSSVTMLFWRGIADMVRWWLT